jgi:two-component system chemotaxis response regulator CheY
MSHILIVDDDTNNQRILSYTLRKAGHEVSVAANGVEGLDALSSCSIDLAIIDLAMPVMDGLTMLRAMRTGPTPCDVPVIMLTASGDDSVRMAVEAESVNGYLTKPSSSRILLEKIKQILGETA